MTRLIAFLPLMALLYAGGAAAQTGFYLPTTTPSSGQDEFRAADGTTCRSTMDGTKRVEVGTFTSAAQNPALAYGYGYTVSQSRAMQGNVGVYGRVSISLDARPERMDCNKLFELELEKRRLEVEIMKRSLLAADRDLDDQRRASPRREDNRRRSESAETKDIGADAKRASVAARSDRARRSQNRSVASNAMAPL